MGDVDDMYAYIPEGYAYMSPAPLIFACRNCTERG